jgi:peptidyl-prolyl cis-trans isomerase D
MFDFVRSHTRLFQFILVILVFPSFVFFGVQGYSRFTEGGRDEVASVDGRGITRTEWEQAHQRASERIRRQMPNLDPKAFDSLEFRRETLDSLVRERVLFTAAQRQFLLPSDERLARLFRTDPQLAAMRNPDGTVNKDILAAQGLTSEGFAQQLRSDFGMRQVLAVAGVSTVASKVQVSTALEAWLQRREVQYDLIEPKAFAAKLQATDADLEAFLKSHEGDFKLPEQAQIEYVQLDLATLKKSVNVPEDDLRKYYEENASRYTSAEERRASHILIKADKDMSAEDRKKAREKAEALLAEVRKSPNSFAELARKNSQDPGSATKGGDLDFFAKGAMVKPFEDAVFGMKAGEISPVIESDFGYHIIQLTGTRGGSKKTLEAVRPEIEDALRTQLARRKFSESAEVFTNTVYEQADSLQPVIDKLKLEKKTATVQRMPAPGATGALASAKFLEAVFGNESLRNKRNTDAVDLGDSQLASARVVQYTPAKTPSLAEVKDKVKEAWVREQSRALALKEGEARVAALKAAPQSALPKTVVVARNQPQGLPRAAIDSVLKVPAEGLPGVMGVDLGPEGYLLARVTRIVPREQAEQQDATFAPQIAQALGAAESALYYEGLKKKFKVELKSVPARAEPTAPASSAGR